MPGIAGHFIWYSFVSVCYFWNCDMSTMINVQTNVRSMAPMIIQATNFVPNFCLFVLLIYCPLSNAIGIIRNLHPHHAGSFSAWASVSAWTGSGNHRYHRSPESASVLNRCVK